MATTTEIAPDVFRISVYVREIDLQFNHFLVRDEQPLLYHTGMKSLFPAVSSAVDRLVGLDRLRWIAFSHVEADECGAMNDFLTVCPHAQVVHGVTGVAVSIADMADREPRTWGPGEVLEIGDHMLTRRVLQLDTPHVPHNWEAQVIFEEDTGTLFSGDLGTQLGDPPALTDADLADAAVEAEEVFRQSSSLTAYVTTLRRLAGLAPRTLAIMHGASFSGNGAAMLERLATAYEQRFDDRAFTASTGTAAELVD